MSVSWGVLPVTSEVRDWLRKLDIGDPGNQDGRYPSLDELLSTLRAVDTWSVQVDVVNDSLREIAAGDLGTDRFAQILGSIQTDGLYGFHFFGSGNREPVMLEILHKLTPICGPFIIYESIAATPAVVASNSDIPSTLDDWLARIRRTYEAADARKNAGT